jgi:hypothetical protein
VAGPYLSLYERGHLGHPRGRAWAGAVLRKMDVDERRRQATHNILAAYCIPDVFEGPDYWSFLGVLPSNTVVADWEYRLDECAVLYTVRLAAALFEYDG